MGSPLVVLPLARCPRPAPTTPQRLPASGGTARPCVHAHGQVLRGGEVMNSRGSGLRSTRPPRPAPGRNAPAVQYFSLNGSGAQTYHGQRGAFLEAPRAR